MIPNADPGSNAGELAAITQSKGVIGGKRVVSAFVSSVHHHLDK